MTPPPHLARRAAVVVAATVAVLLVAALALPELVAVRSGVQDGSWRSASFEGLLVPLCALAALVAGGCWWAGVLRLVVAAAPGADPAHLPAPAGLPPWLRRAVLAACGGVLVAAPAVPALAADGTGGAGGAGTDPIAALALPAATGDLPSTGPRGLPLPDRVAGEAPRTHEPGSTTPRALPPRAATGSGTPTPGPPPAPLTTVRVVPGDSLWAIAEAQLRSAGGPVDDAAVAARWQEIYAANAGRIGPDPDLVLPGQQLDLDRP